MAKQSRGWLWSTALVVVASLILAALAFFMGRIVSPPARPLGPILGSAAQSSAPAAVKALREDIVGYEPIARAGQDWLYWGTIAQDALGLAQLTGNYDDFARAERSLDEAFKIAADRAGPHSLLASFNFSVHRLGASEAALDQINRYALAEPPYRQAEYLAMRGDIAVYRGQYRQARDAYVTAAADGAPASALCRLALLESWMGEPDQALATIDRCEAAPPTRTPQFVASAAMQRGVIELNRGNWAAALAHFKASEKAFPGHWMTAMRLAQMRALMGDVDGAIADFTTIANQTNNPDPMDILAGLYRAKGNAQASKTWAARAGALWAVRIKLFPEAAAAHALEHELAFGEPKRALALAKINVNARPFGESYLGLAKAWLANGRPDFTVALVNMVNRSGWVSTQQYLLLSDAEAIRGRAGESEAARMMAIKINPRAGERNPAFSWLDH
jgi:tetratricopeptide (TPR) repeat protein